VALQGRPQGQRRREVAQLSGRFNESVLAVIGVQKNGKIYYFIHT
jgi:hypothetical protein